MDEVLQMKDPKDKLILTLEDIINGLAGAGIRKHKAMAITLFKEFNKSEPLKFEAALKVLKYWLVGEGGGFTGSVGDMTLNDILLNLFSLVALEHETISREKDKYEKAIREIKPGPPCPEAADVNEILVEMLEDGNLKYPVKKCGKYSSYPAIMHVIDYINKLSNTNEKFKTMVNNNLQILILCLVGLNPDDLNFSIKTLLLFIFCQIYNKPEEFVYCNFN